MKYLKIFLVCVFLFLAERCFFSRFEIFSLTPWLGFSFFAAAAAMCEYVSPVIVAAGIYGIITDLSGGAAVGSQTAVFVIFTLVQHLMCTGIFRKNAAVVTVSSFVTAFFAACAFFVLNFAALPAAKLSEAFLPVILPLAALNTIFILAFCFPAKKLFERRRLY